MTRADAALRRVVAGIALPLLAGGAPLPGTLAAQETPTAPTPGLGVAAGTHPGDLLTVYLVTMGPGDQIWEKFGHNAIRIVDRSRGTDVSWNWGMFSFDQADFIPRLVRGTMLYSMGGFPTAASLEEYAAAGRDVWMQELELTGAQKLALQSSIHRHYLPENRDYRYDYYRDNCSTRVRDELDAALGGALRDALVGEPTGTTYRWHTRRLLAASPLAYTGIQLVLGNLADEPIDEWAETFLPLRLRQYVAEVTVSDGRGGRAPLVRNEVQAVDAARPPEPAEPPSRLLPFLLLGLLWAVAVAGSGARVVGRGRASVALFAAVAGLWCLVAGGAGTVLALAWPFTDHEFWGWNENLLQADPLALAVFVGLAWSVVGGRVPAWAVRLGVGVAALSVLGFVLQPLPGLDQTNGEIIAFALPVNLALAWALTRQRGHRDPRAARAAAIPRGA